jgi:porin
VGYFFYNFSNALQDSLDPFVNFDDEHGIEAFYSVAVTPWFYITGDLQYIDPASGDDQNAFIAALRANIRF